MNRPDNKQKEESLKFVVKPETDLLADEGDIAIVGNAVGALSKPDLGARYDVLDYVGAGGMGTVWKVHDKELNEVFAIKVLKPELLSDETSVKRFQQEARLASDLTHANIAAIFGPGEDTAGRPFIIMRYVEGESLADILKREGKLDPERAMDIFWQVHAALAHSHMKGIVHRDIKPSNIIISRTESGGEIVSIIDFGISKSIYEQFSKTQALTKAIDVFGSPQYMSPEQLLGKEVGPESDFYSLGCVLYEMITGAPPFVSESPVELVVMQLNETANMTSIPSRYVETLGICLEKAPENRKLLPGSDGLRTSGHIATHFEYAGRLKYTAAIAPIISMIIALSGAASGAEMTLVKVLIIELLLFLFGHLLVSLNDMQAIPSRSSKAVTAAFFVGLTAAFFTGIVCAIFQYLTQAELFVSIVFPISLVSIVVSSVLTARLDLTSLYDRAIRFITLLSTKNPSAFRKNTGICFKLLDFASVALSHLIAITAGAWIALPILFGKVPDLFSTLSFGFCFIVSIAFLRALTKSAASLQGDKKRRDMVKEDCFRQLKLVAVYSVFAFCAAKLLVPLHYIEGANLYEAFSQSQTKDEREALYDKAIALPHGPLQDYFRICIASIYEGKNVNREKVSELLQQVIENPTNRHSTLKADALARLGYYQKDPQERLSLQNKAFDTLVNAKANSTTDFREALLMQNALKPIDVAESLSNVAASDGNVSLAERIADYVENIPDSHISDKQKAAFDQAISRARAKAEGLSIPPTSPTPQQ